MTDAHQPPADPGGAPRWMTIAEFRARYRVGHTFAHALLREGQIRRVKVGRMTRIPLASAEAWAATIESGKGGAS